MIRTSWFAFSLFACVASAQDLGIKAPAAKQPVVIRNAVLHTLDRGTILGGTIWFQDGVIRGVHAQDEAVTVPKDAKPLLIDGTGKHIYPGLIAANTQLGLQELQSVRQSVDLDEIGELSPEVIAAVAVNPDSTLLPVTRSNGVLIAAVFPSGGLIPGRASVIQLDGWTNRDLAVLPDAGVVIDWPALPAETPGRGMRGGRRPQAPGTPGAPGATPTPPEDPTVAVQRQRAQIDEAFAKARAWIEAKKADKNTPADLRAQALVPAAMGEQPVFLLADEAEEIDSAIAWALGAKLRPIVVGGRDALLCDGLRRAQVPVIVNGVLKLPARDDLPYDDAFTFPARLKAAGIPFCIASGEPFYNERNLPYQAAAAAAHGLDREAALAAITRDAAQILGVGQRLGTLTVGKDATILVTDGDPLELTTRIHHAFVQGREIDLRNKQTELARKYREKYRQLDVKRDGSAGR